MVANKLLIGIGGTLAAAALTIGAVSATPGGPIAFDDDDTQTEQASPTPVAEEEDGDEVEDEDDLEEQDSDDLVAEGDEDDSAGNQKIAEAIAEEFDTTPEEVLALHDEGIGFGAIFKLYLLARAKGITVDELLAQIEEDGGGFAFGNLKKSLSEEEMEIFEDGPKNLGELVSASNHEDGDAEDAEEGETSLRGSPGNAKSKGHGKKN